MSKHTVEDWMVEGNTVYALNAEGSNRFCAQVQPGWATEGRLRTEKEEVEANARIMGASLEMFYLLKALVKTRGNHFINNDISGMYEWDEKVSVLIAKVSGEAQ